MSLKSLAKKVSRELKPKGPLAKLATKAGRSGYSFGKKNIKSAANKAAGTLGAGPRMRKNYKALKNAFDRKNK